MLRVYVLKLVLGINIYKIYIYTYLNLGISFNLRILIKDYEFIFIVISVCNLINFFDLMNDNKIMFHFTHSSQFSRTTRFLMKFMFTNSQLSYSKLLKHKLFISFHSVSSLSLYQNNLPGQIHNSEFDSFTETIRYNQT